MENFNNRRMYNNSTASDCVSKSWAYNRRQPSESDSQATRIQGRNVMTPWCFHRRSCLNAACDVTKTRTKNTSTCKVNPKREIQNVRHFDTPRTFPNPYAPHLKYGIFPKNRSKPKSPTKRTSSILPREYIDLKREESTTESPYFSVRPLVQEDLEIVSRNRALGWNNEYHSKFI